MGNMASTGFSPPLPITDIPNLPPTPPGWDPLSLIYIPAALPPLPHLSDESRARLDVVLGTDPIRRFSWDGDSGLQHASTRVLTKATAALEYQHLSKWIYFFRASVLSNNVFSYLALSYGLISPQVAQTRAQKTSADLFEAYLGACDLERDTMESSYELTLFLRALFSEAVWPALPLLVRIFTRKSLSKQLVDQAVKVLRTTWPGVKIASRLLPHGGSIGAGNEYQVTIAPRLKKSKKKSRMMRGMLKVGEASVKTSRKLAKEPKAKKTGTGVVMVESSGVEIIDLCGDDEDDDWEDASTDSAEVDAMVMEDSGPRDDARVTKRARHAADVRVTRSAKKEIIDLTMESEDEAG